MMITITSMKKIQEPDLLLDQPRNNHHNSPKYMINNINKTGRFSPRHSPKNRRGSGPGFAVPIPLASPNESTSSTFTSSTTISSPCSPIDPCDSLSNNHLILEGLEDSNSRWPRHSHPHHHHQYNHQRSHHQYHSQSNESSPQTIHCNNSPWTRPSSATKTSSISSLSSGSTCCNCTLPDYLNVKTMNKRNLIFLGIIIFILFTSLVTFLALILRPVKSDLTDNYNLSTVNFISSDIDTKKIDDIGLALETDEDSYDYDSGKSIENSKNNLDLKEVSRLSWDLLNSNQERINGVGGSSISSIHRHKNNNLPSHTLVPSSFASISGGGEELVLPNKMIFTSGGGDVVKPDSDGESSSSGNNKNKKTSCCRTQKYSQVIKRDGCEPLTIANRMCFGQCLSVWVPGIFASFPVCRPSRSSWKTVTLTCGKNRDRKKRVRIEKVRRCSCMEIEPTVPSQVSGSKG